MNYIKDDYGRMVVAVGAPGSVARVKCQYPKLIERFDSWFWGEHSQRPPRGAHSDALDEMVRMGITSPMERQSIIDATSYYECVVIPRRIPLTPQPATPQEHKSISAPGGTPEQETP